jgi:hypothetical protein
VCSSDLGLAQALTHDRAQVEMNGLAQALTHDRAQVEMNGLAEGLRAPVLTHFQV